VAGYEYKVRDYVPKLWKNGLDTHLTDETKTGRAESITISGSNVYVVGYESNGIHKVAKLWKNGVATDLTDGTKDAEAHAIFVPQ
jgi:hypothetical protein